MATEKVICHDTAPAGADLSSKQFTLVKFDSSGNLVAASTGDKGFVLQDNPIQGRYGTYALVGITKVKLGGTVAAGDYLAANSSGLAVTATNTVTSAGVSYSQGTAGQHIIGQALRAGVSGDVGNMLIANGLA